MVSCTRDTPRNIDTKFLKRIGTLVVPNKNHICCVKFPQISGQPVALNFTHLARASILGPHRFSDPNERLIVDNNSNTSTTIPVRRLRAAASSSSSPSPLFSLATHAFDLLKLARWPPPPQWPSDTLGRVVGAYGSGRGRRERLPT